MNIAVYSGSFNPLHIGHLAIIKHLIEEAGFDMVYLIVSPKNPLKDGISASTGLDRYYAAVEAVNRHFTFREVSEADAPMTPAFPTVSARCKGPQEHLQIARDPLAGGGMSSPHSASETSPNAK
jgi:cytidyltransferase-like protein